MELTFKFKPKLSLIQTAIIEELSFHTTKLYNTANYDCITNRFKTYVDMEKLHKSNWHREFLHSHNYQHCLKLLDQNWKSYFKSIADFKKNPSKYNGMPMPPKYKNINNKKNEVIFTAVGIRFNFTKDYLHKASKQLVDYAVKHHCKTIVIGDISNIKQGN